MISDKQRLFKFGKLQRFNQYQKCEFDTPSGKFSFYVDPVTVAIVVQTGIQVYDLFHGLFAGHNDTADWLQKVSGQLQTIMDGLDKVNQMLQKLPIVQFDSDLVQFTVRFYTESRSTQNMDLGRFHAPATRPPSANTHPLCALTATILAKGSRSQQPETFGLISGPGIQANAG